MSYTVTREGTSFRVESDDGSHALVTFAHSSPAGMLAASAAEEQRAQRDRSSDPASALRHAERAKRYVALARWLEAEDQAQRERAAAKRREAAQRVAATRKARAGLPTLASIDAGMRRRSAR